MPGPEEFPSKDYSASHVANFILTSHNNKKQPITQMKLQKLVYMSYGWVIGVIGEKLFDEPIYAWAHGPVVRSLYDEFKHFGRESVTDMAIDLDLDTVEFSEPHIPESDTRTLFVLQVVENLFGDFSASQLRTLTHKEETPWHQVYRHGKRGIEIPPDLIRRYFFERISLYMENANGRQQDAG